MQGESRAAGAGKQESADHSLRVMRDNEVEEFAAANGITAAQARELMRRFGTERKVLEREARKLA